MLSVGKHTGTSEEAKVIDMVAPKKLVCFLDFDDVICLNAPYGGYDVLTAFGEAARTQQQVNASDDLWQKLFSAQAKDNLREIHQSFEITYVLSTSWRWFFDKDALMKTLSLGGLGWVAENLHEDWSTPLISKQAFRGVEIKAWLARHIESEDAWVVLDDELSGTGFATWTRKAREYVVLCQVGGGLQGPEVIRLKNALAQRSSN